MQVERGWTVYVVALGRRSCKSVWFGEFLTTKKQLKVDAPRRGVKRPSRFSASGVDVSILHNS